LASRWLVVSHANVRWTTDLPPSGFQVLGRVGGFVSTRVQTPPLHLCCGIDNCQPRLCAASPSAQISGFGPDPLDRRKEVLQTLQQEVGSCAIMDVGGMHPVLRQRALGVDEQMTLAALDLFATVVSPLARPSQWS
jgi:hypothetical protein